MDTNNVDTITQLNYQIFVDINPASPGAPTVGRIDVQLPVRVVWILPPGFQFSAAGVSGLIMPDFDDNKFDGWSRRRFRWTARSGGSGVEQTYSLSYEYMDAAGVLHSFVVPNFKIVNRS